MGPEDLDLYLFVVFTLLAKVIEVLLLLVV